MADHCWISSNKTEYDGHMLIARNSMPIGSLLSRSITTNWAVGNAVIDTILGKNDVALVSRQRSAGSRVLLSVDCQLLLSNYHSVRLDLLINLV
jgi:hypothetical protein